MKEDDVQVKVPLKMCGSSSSSSPPCLHDITTFGQSIFCLVFFVKGNVLQLVSQRIWV
ncbi:hypothetical protein Bca101_064751 [Brassica carinata]